MNPFAERLTFLDDRTHTRRDHGKYLTLIRCVALLHQHQREVRTVEQAGRRLDYIEATIDDIAAANRLAHEMLGRCLDDMPPQTRRLLELLDQMAREACADRKIEREHFLFSRRDVRSFIGWGDTQLRIHLDRLVALEYLLPHRGARGQRFVYELVYDGGGKDGGRFLPKLINVEQLRSGMSTPEHLAGENDQFAGGSRGHNGAVAAGARAGFGVVAASGNSPAIVLVPVNAHPAGTALVAAP